MKKSIAIILSIMLVLSITLPAAALKSITVKSIKLNSSKITLKVGQTFDLKVTLIPTNTTQKLLTYATANKKIATVDENGKITAVRVGTTVIKVYSSSNKKIFAKCNVTISQLAPLTLHILTDNPTEWNDYPNNPVAKELKKQTGITIQWEVANVDKIKVMLAGGDLPDIVLAKNSPTSQQYKQLIEGKNVIPLDDLIKTNGKNISSTMPQMLDFSRKNLSNNTNKLYFLTVGIGDDPAGIENGIGPIIRWDYYKELGYPKINNFDDLLSVIDQMQKKHPTTADGKKVYGVSFWSDWGNWSIQMMASFMKGYVGNTNSHDPNLAYVPAYTAVDGPYWSGIDFLYKANKLGILDPDALVQGYEDVHTKITNGQILYAVANWPFDNFNNAHNKDAQGYMALPLDWADQWYGMKYYAGYPDKAYCITTNCKTPERAMDLFNYLWSYDGARLVFSGVKGQHWNIINGTAVENPAAVKMRAEGNAKWTQYKIRDNGSLNQIVGLSAITINPADKAPVSLFDTPEIYYNALNPLQKDFSDHYGVKYPAQAFLNLVNSGKVNNQGKYNPYIDASIPPQPDDIKTIMSKVDAYFTTAAAKCILSKTDAEYKANKQKAIDDINALGYGKFNDWYDKAWKAAKASFGLK